MELVPTLASEAVTGLVGVFGALGGAIASHLLDARWKSREERERIRSRREEMRNQAFVLLSTFRSTTLISIARWKMIREITSVEALGPDQSPFTSSQYFELSSFCRFWFPNTIEAFDLFDSNTTDILGRIESADQSSINSFLNVLRTCLDEAAENVERLSSQLQSELVDHAL